MLYKNIRLPSGAQAQKCATPRLSATRTTAAASVTPSPSSSRAQRPTLSARAAAFESAAVRDEAIHQAPRVAALRLTAEAETAAAAATVTARFVVPHFVTKPGQQLFLSGSTSELGEWDPDSAAPLEWREGHQHVALVRLPAGRVVQVKLVLKENGQPVFMEDGDSRDVMLMLPVSEASEQQQQQQQQQVEFGLQEIPAVPAAAQGGAVGWPTVSTNGSATASATAGVDYQVMCHFGNTEATQILRLPVVLPPKQSGDRRVLCKFVVMLDALKLEPRQYPVLVGSCEELGSWKAEAGVKLIRQVGGYWTKRVELPLLDGPLHAKVVICNADGQAAAWEPGTANRVLSVNPQQPVWGPASASAPPEGGSGAAAMQIFVCRWSQPDHTPVVSVPVEHERADKEFLKQLDAAQREIGIMRRAVTAKSRQCQSLESELAASRRSERALRDEVTGLRSEIGYLVQEMEVAQHGELAARQEAVEFQRELQQLRDGYERQIAFLESKLDEMEQAILSLQQRLASSSSSSSSLWSSSSATAYDQETPRVYSRSNWR